MGKHLPAVYYHPTTVVCVDDSAPFLQNLRFVLNCNQAAYKFFASPELALKYFEKDYHPSKLIDNCLFEAEVDELDCQGISANVRQIHREIYNAQRFADVGVIVVDYAMPELNGLVLCKRLASLPIRKILLTAEADERIGIEAFNQGLINKFVRKDASNFQQLINEAIYEEQIKYFQSVAQTVANSFTSCGKGRSSFLTDPVIDELIDNTMRAHNLLEFYLMDVGGNFLFLDAEGNPSWLVIKSDVELQELYDFARFSEASPSTIDKLLERKVVPYFHTDEEFCTPPSRWDQFFHLANKLIGKQVYYYSYFAKADTKFHDIGEVVSFNQYLKQIY